MVDTSGILTTTFAGQSFDTRFATHVVTKFCCVPIKTCAFSFVHFNAPPSEVMYLTTNVFQTLSADTKRHIKAIIDYPSVYQ